VSELIIAIDARLAGGDSTGDSSYWSGLLHGLSKISLDARFLLFSNADKPPGIPKEFEWVTIPSRNSRWWSMVAFPLAARKKGASVIHTQYNLSPLCANRGITTVHDVSFFIGPQWFRTRDLLLLRRFVPASVRRAKRVITVSQTSKDEIESNIQAARGKTLVTHLACPVHIDANASIDVQTQFGLDQPFLLSVGTRWPRKNMALAVEAARLAQYPLVLTGKPGWGEADYPQHVKAVGYVDSATLSSLYRQSAMYLAPSKHEGFGLPVLEAFMCNCPVICSYGGALPEVAGDAAIVMQSWQAQDWATTIQESMVDSSKLDDLRRRGRERLAQFSWEKTASQTMDIYQQVAMESGS
jgi:glycosyltransferase involved in cell wall biosynthesis